MWSPGRHRLATLERHRPQPPKQYRIELLEHHSLGSADRHHLHRVESHPSCPCACATVESEVIVMGQLWDVSND